MDGNIYGIEKRTIFCSKCRGSIEVRSGGEYNDLLKAKCPYCHGYISYEYEKSVKKKRAVKIITIASLLSVFYIAYRGIHMINEENSIKEYKESKKEYVVKENKVLIKLDEALNKYIKDYTEAEVSWSVTNKDGSNNPNYIEKNTYTYKYDFETEELLILEASAG